MVFGGHKLYFLEPVPEDYEPFRVANALANEARFAGNYGDGYSVCQHSVLVSMTIEALGGTPRQGLAGLVHDASEMVTGDLPSPLKAHLTGFPYLEALQNTAIEARYGVDLDDALVKTADKVVLAAEVRMLVPGPEQGLFNVDTEFMRANQPSWQSVLPWPRNEVVGGFMDRLESILAEIGESTPDERN